MKIISKFKDYYDKLKCHVGMCSDDFTYIRKQESLLDTSIQKYTKSYSTIFNRIDTTYRSNLFENTVTAGLLGFCGKIHIVYKVERREESWQGVFLRNKLIGYFYGAEAFTHAFKSNKLLKKVKDKRGEFSYSTSLYKTIDKLPLEEAKNKIALNRHKQTKEALNGLIQLLHKEDFFTKYKTPTFYVTTELFQTNVVINPCLEELQFYKALDGMQTYGQIEQFLGNELLPKDNPDQITDNLILAGNHGYDKWSFRQKGPKNKKRKQKRKPRKSDR